MGLLDRLKTLGCRLRLIRTVARRPDVPKKIAPRVTSLEGLKAEVLQQAQGDLHEELSPSLDKVFEAAGLARQAWSVERLRDLLRGEPYRSMDRPGAKQAILQSLAAETVKVEELVQDARSRVQALDAFEGRALARMQDRRGIRRRQREAMERQITRLNEECRALNAADQDDEQALQQWRGRKAAYEKDMAWAIGFLVETPVDFAGQQKS